MPNLFSRLKGRDHTVKSKDKNNQANSRTVPLKPEYEDAWARNSVEPEEVYELLHRSIPELKLRGLDIPFLLLPYRPTSNTNAARSFIRGYFEHRLEGENLAHELRLVEPMVLCSIIKWCWSRIAGGVVGWDAYQLFKVGESVAANSKFNGLGGKKLSRLAGWWAFEQSDDGNGFEGGYEKWTTAADATCHLFFAYLRSLSPELGKGLSCISRLPVSLQKLVQETEYPPEPPKNMQTQTSMVLMIVDRISPTPLALLRRASHFNYRDDDKILTELSNYSDPEEALTTECRRVLELIASENQTHVLSLKDPTDPTQVSWARFEDLGFSGCIHENIEVNNLNKVRPNLHEIRDVPQTKFISGRPTTPSWGQFLSSGFVNVESISSLPLQLPNNLSLPPLEVRSQSSQSFRPDEEETQLPPGELASISKLHLDDAFWWVWISSLAIEEYAERKAVFGRCALIETVIPSGKWILIEEKVKGAQSTPQSGAYIAEKKHFWSRAKKCKLSDRRKSVGVHLNQKSKSEPSQSRSFAKTDASPDTHARIQAAAVRLQKMHHEELADKFNGSLKSNCSISTNINNISTLQPNILREASPAMNWAKNYDKITTQEKHVHDYNPSPVSNISYEDLQPRCRDHKPTLIDEKLFASLVDMKDKLSKETVHYVPTNENIEKAKFVQDFAPRPANNINIDEEKFNEREPQITHDLIRLRSRKNSASAGLKKFLGMNKPPNLQITDHPPQTSVGREAVERMIMGNSLARKLSGRKEKPVSSAGKLSPVPNYSPTGKNLVLGSRKDSLVSSQATGSIAVPSTDNISRLSSREENKAQQEFSRFDQGPLEDFSSSAADSEIDENGKYLRPSPITHPKTTISDQNLSSISQNEVKEPTSRQATEDVKKPANRQTTEEVPNDRNLKKYEVENIEETIEARVARIKARVAQLTDQSESGTRLAQRTNKVEAGTRAAQLKGKSEVGARVAQLTSRLEAGTTSKLPIARQA